MDAILGTKEKTLTYMAAFDYALLKLARKQILNVRKDSLEYSRIAVNASHYHCGPIARFAERWLNSKGLRGAKFHSLSGHYVLRDEETGFLFDLESIGGAVNKIDIPVYQRIMHINDMTQRHGKLPKEQIEEIFIRSAENLLLKRKAAICEDSLSKQHKHSFLD